MYITLESDYAVRIISCLANRGKRLDAKTISDETCVTIRFSLKILRKLVAAGLVISFKGTQGGYELARTSDKISLKEVIEAVEGTYMLNRCLETNYACSRTFKGECKYKQAFSEITDYVNAKLESYTFDKFFDEK